MTCTQNRCAENFSHTDEYPITDVTLKREKELVKTVLVTLKTVLVTLFGKILF